MDKQQFETMKSLMSLSDEAEELCKTFDLEPDELFLWHDVESKKQLKLYLTDLNPDCEERDINAIINMDLVLQFNNVCKIKIISGVILHESADEIAQRIIENLPVLNMSHTELYEDRIEFSSSGEPVGIMMPFAMTIDILQTILFYPYRFKEKDVSDMMDAITAKIIASDSDGNPMAIRIRNI